MATKQLTGKQLTEITELDTSNYIDLLDKDLYYTATPIPSRRHRVNNNILGNPHFCPLVRRTALLAEYENQQLDQASREVIRHYSKHVIARAIHFLYTKETKSSYKIEHEEPSEDRVSRFVNLLKAAGKLVFRPERMFTVIRDERIGYHLKSEGPSFIFILVGFMDPLKNIDVPIEHRGRAISGGRDWGSTSEFHDSVGFRCVVFLG